MERQRIPDKVSITACTDDARALRRVAALLPHVAPHAIALRALRAGLPLVEADIRRSAAQLVGELDREGL